uniref:uncharacterized protein LOC132665078 n=1 Tax=Panthera onca TaxID=9690 RepID=UPI00295409B9|nr:uncharacterized protein LOC132665078 [Panthera onca]
MFLSMRLALRLRCCFLLFSCLPSPLPFCCFFKMPADSSLMLWHLNHNPLHDMLACFWRWCEPQSRVRSVPFPEFTRSCDTRSWQHSDNYRSPVSLGHTALPYPLPLVVIAHVFHVYHLCINHGPDVMSQTHLFTQLLSELATEGGRNVVHLSLPAIWLFGRTQPPSGALDFSLKHVLLYFASWVGPAGGKFRLIVAVAVLTRQSLHPLHLRKMVLLTIVLLLDRRFAHAAHGLRARAGPAEKSPSVPRKGRIFPSLLSGFSPCLWLSAFVQPRVGLSPHLSPSSFPGTYVTIRCLLHVTSRCLSSAAALSSAMGTLQYFSVKSGTCRLPQAASLPACFPTRVGAFLRLECLIIVYRKLDILDNIS